MIELKFEQYLKVNNNHDNKKVPVLLSLIERKMYELLHSLMTLRKPKIKMFDELIVVTNHLSPRLSIIHKQNKPEGKNVNTKYNKLKETIT